MLIPNPVSKMGKSEFGMDFFGKNHFLEGEETGKYIFSLYLSKLKQNEYQSIDLDKSYRMVCTITDNAQLLPRKMDSKKKINFLLEHPRNIRVPPFDVF